MLKDHLVKLRCPLCKLHPENWTIDGDLVGNRISDGAITCSKGHIWNVQAEILRFDLEKNDSPTQHLHQERTGFPAKNYVSEPERKTFLERFEDYFTEFSNSLDAGIEISDNSILFLKSMKSEPEELLIFNDNEGLLGQIQEILVQKNIYKYASLIKVAEKKKIRTLSNKKFNPFEFSIKSTIDKEVHRWRIYFAKKNLEIESPIWTGDSYTLAISEILS